MRDEITLGLNMTGIKLLTHLMTATPDTNIFISPMSIGVALALALNGARGRTYRDMADSLGWGGHDRDTINADWANWLRELNNLGASVTLTTADSVWVRPDLTLAPDFVRRVQAVYDATVEVLDRDESRAASRINAWVDQRTRHMIPQLIQPADLRQVVLLLLNAIHFKGQWGMPFDPAETKNGLFTCLDGSQLELPMMSRSSQYEYNETDTLQVIGLPYGEGQATCYIALPKPPYTVYDFQRELTLDTLAEWLNSVRPIPGEITLPRFHVDYGGSLREALIELGMTEPFTPTADFRDMGVGELCISDVVHKAVLAVDEAGTEASAATAVMMGRGLPPTPFEMVVNRPFLCAITHNQAGIILFLGAVLRPTPG